MLLKKLRNQYTHYVNGQIELKEIIVFMARWLIDHIIAEQNDRALARYLRSSDKYRNLLTLENSN
jgi:hemerythrin